MPLVLPVASNASAETPGFLRKAAFATLATARRNSNTSILGHDSHKSFGLNSAWGLQP